jgi:tetratricopeptide (TPR) repeat protein
MAAVAAGVVCVASLVAPMLADRAVDSSTRALERRDFAAAVDDADRARSLDPFSLEPLLARARAQWLGGDQAAALASFRDAVDLQPENPDSWEELGLYLFDRDDLCGAYAALNEAYTRDPRGRQWSKGGPLDVARDYVNREGCG